MAMVGAQLRLVRCPKCLKVLSEPGGVLMYKCGGCGAILRAKNPQAADAGSQGGSSGIAEIGAPSSAVAASDGKEKVSENTELLATAKSSEKESRGAKTDYSFNQQEDGSLQVRDQDSDNSRLHDAKASPESASQSNVSEERLALDLRSPRVSSSDDGTQNYLHGEPKVSPAASQSITSEEEMLDRPHAAMQSDNLRASTASSSDDGSRKYHHLPRRTKGNKKGSSEANTEYSFNQEEEEEREEEEEKSLNAKERDSDNLGLNNKAKANGSGGGFDIAHGHRRGNDLRSPTVSSSDDGTQNYLHEELKASPALSQGVASEEEILEKPQGATQSNNLRSSTASSSDDGSHKYRQMSRRTIRDQRFSGSVSTKSGGGGEDLSRNSSVNANAQRRGSLKSEAFFSVQSWVESEEERPSRSLSGVSAFSEHPPKLQDESTKFKNLKLLELVEELRDQLSEKKPRSRLGYSQDTFLDDYPGTHQCPQQYRSSQMPVSYLHCHLEPDLCCNSRLCPACSYNFCCRSSQPRRPVQHQKARTTKSYCRPMSGGAPFVTCSNCFEVLHVPADFLVSTSRRLNKLKCGACSVVMVLSLPARGAHQVSQASDGAAGKPPEAPISSSGEYGTAFADSSSVEAEPVLNVSRASPRPRGASSARLHRLMGYGSARLLLF